MKLLSVGPRQGLWWVRQGFVTFARQPLAFTGLFFIYLAAMSVLSWVPVLGRVLPLVLVPAATLGFMVASAQAREGQFPMPTVLISAFQAGRDRAKDMLVLGVIYAVAISVVFSLTSLLDDGQLAGMMIGSDGVPVSQEDQPMPSGLGRAMLLSMALYAPVALLFWHAPALVHWHGISPAKALFASLLACWRNLGAFVMYAVGWALVMLGCALVVSVMAVMVMGQPQVAAIAMMPVALFLATVFFASFYATFVDCFSHDDPGPGIQDTTPARLE